MKEFLQKNLFIIIVATAVLFIFYMKDIKHQAELRRLTNEFTTLVGDIGELKQINDNLYQRLEVSEQNINKKLSNFGKDMVKQKDIKGLFMAVAEISGKIEGDGTVSDSGVLTIQEKEDGFTLDGVVLFLPNGKARWNFLYKLDLQLEGFAQEVSPGVFKTSIYTGNKNVKIKDFNFKITPYKPNYFERISIGPGISYNRLLKKTGTDFELDKSQEINFIGISMYLFLPPFSGNITWYPMRQEELVLNVAYTYWFYPFRKRRK